MTDDEKYLAVIDRMIDLEQALRVQRNLWEAVGAGRALTDAAILANIAHIEAVLAGRVPEPWSEAAPC